MRAKSTSASLLGIGLITLVSAWLAVPQAAFGAGIRVAKLHDDPNGNGELNRGQRLQYTIIIANLGPSDISVDLTDMIPTGTMFFAVDDNGGGTVVTMSPILQIDAIPVMGSGLAQVVFTVVEDGTLAPGTDICNVAAATCAPDPPVMTPPACIRIASASLSIIKTHDDPNGNGQLNPGQTLRYTITVTSSLPSATTVNLTDPIPPGVAFATVVDDGGGTVVTTTPTLQIDDIPLPIAGTTDVVFEVTEDGSVSGGQDVCNIATIDSPSLPGPLQSPPACIAVAEPMTLALISKSHDDPNMNGELDRGQTLVYTVRIENTGVSLISDASITDIIPAGVTFVSVSDDGGGTVVTTSPILEIISIPVAARSLTNVVFSVVEDGSEPDGSNICNVVSLDTMANPSTLDSAPACIQVRDTSAVVLVSKRHDDPNSNGELNRGQTLRYTLRIDNGSGSDLADASVIDSIPEGATLVSVIDDGGGTVISTTPTLQIDNIPVAGGGFTEVVFEVVEDGAKAHGEDICNVTTLDTSINPGTVSSRPACITVNAPCNQPGLTVRTLLKGAKVGGGSDAANFQWTADAEATEYHLNSVADKSDLTSPGPLQMGGGFVECASATADCSDDDALVDPKPRLFYQAISACGPDAADEGPI